MEISFISLYRSPLALVENLRVHLRSLEILMTKQLADRIYVRPLFKHQDRKRMPCTMERDMLVNPGSTHTSRDIRPYRLRGHRVAEYQSILPPLSSSSVATSADMSRYSSARIFFCVNTSRVPVDDSTTFDHLSSDTSLHRSPVRHENRIFPQTYAILSIVRFIIAQVVLICYFVT